MMIFFNRGNCAVIASHTEIVAVNKYLGIQWRDQVSLKRGVVVD